MNHSHTAQAQAQTIDGASPPPEAGGVPVERFPAFDSLTGIVHAFVRRIPSVDVDLTKAEVVARLAPWHAAAAESLGFRSEEIWTAQQVHGAEVAEVPCPVPGSPQQIPGVDGLMTAQRRVLLGIHVADCAPVYLADPVQRVIALLHSGKRGSEGGIILTAIRAMQEAHRCEPRNIVVQIGPCIRPPHYETDFAALIRTDAAKAGIAPGNLHDCLTCTASNPERYYSYRRELGRTGRLLALLGMT